MTKIDRCLFKENSIGVEVINTKQWTEMLQLTNTMFRECTKGLVFRSPVSPGTSSYANSRLDTVGFGASKAATFIEVESDAGVYSGHWTNLHFWAGSDNITCIKISGSMKLTKLFYPVFESFVSDPTALIGIDIGPGAAPPWIMGTEWVGNWTTKINNPNGEWLNGVGEVYKRSVDLTLGTNSEYGPTATLLQTYKFALIGLPRIYLDVGGTFASGETVTVRIRAVYIDGGETEITVNLTSTGIRSLTDQEYYWLANGNSFLEKIEAEGYSNQASTNVTVSVRAYGAGI